MSMDNSRLAEGLSVLLLYDQLLYQINCFNVMAPGLPGSLVEEVSQNLEKAFEPVAAALSGYTHDEIKELRDRLMMVSLKHALNYGDNT